MGLELEEVMTGTIGERGVNEVGAREKCERWWLVLHCDQGKSMLCWEESFETLKQLWQIVLTVIERRGTLSIK